MLVQPQSLLTHFHGYEAGVLAGSQLELLRHSPPVSGRHLQTAESLHEAIPDACEVSFKQLVDHPRQHFHLRIVSGAHFAGRMSSLPYASEVGQHHRRESGGLTLRHPASCLQILRDLGEARSKKGTRSLRGQLGDARTSRLLLTSLARRCVIQI